MEVVRELSAPVAPGAWFAHVADLGDYSAWMPLIHDVTALPSELDSNPAWIVELRAQVGPFARSKRLRMERTELVEHERVVFERREADEREHSPWVLGVEISDDSLTGAAPDAASTLTMTLSYGGSLWAGPVLERVLDDQVRRGSERLLDIVS